MVWPLSSAYSMVTVTVCTPLRLVFRANAPDTRVHTMARVSSRLSHRRPLLLTSALMFSSPFLGNEYQKAAATNGCSRFQATQKEGPPIALGAPWSHHMQVFWLWPHRPGRLPRNFRFQ